MKTIVCLIGLLLVGTSINSQDGESGGIVVGPVATGYTGPCPVPVHFRAKIDIRWLVKIRYRWERSDGSTSPWHSAQLINGKLDVEDGFWVGKAGQAFTVTDRFRYSLDDEKKESTLQAESKGNCTQ